MQVTNNKHLRKKYRRRVPIRPNIQPDIKAFICPVCDVLLADGPHYDFCPSCDLSVDWVDTSKPIWACSTCDSVTDNPIDSPPICNKCGKQYVLVHNPQKSEIGKVRVPKISGVREAIFSWQTIGILSLLALVPALLLGLVGSDKRWLIFGLIGPLIFFPFALSVVFLGGFGIALSAIKDLVKDKKARVIHGLEHATARILEDSEVTVLGGNTQEGSFTLNFEDDKSWKFKEKSIKSAFRSAVSRIKKGEKRLALHPRCGTSLLVAGFFISLFGVFTGIAGVFVDLSLTQLLILLGFVFGFGLLLIKPLGILTQRAFTVSTSYSDTRLVKIVRHATKERGKLKYEIFVNVEL